MFDSIRSMAFISNPASPCEASCSSGSPLRRATRSSLRVGRQLSLAGLVLFATSTSGSHVAAQDTTSLSTDATAISASLIPGAVTSKSNSSVEVAAEVDRLIAAELAAKQLEPEPRLDDALWVRRAFLDVVGRPPTPDELLVIETSGTLDREWLIESLINNEQYGQNWGRYWRDAIFYRRLEERSIIAAAPTASFFTEQLNGDVAWSQIVSDMIVASGDASEDGRVGLIVAQQGRPEETVSEISRLFLGIQIQCAQCHDHPTDRWTREQFHELAAFFPRVSARPNPDPERRTIEVTAQDRFIRRQPRDAMNRFQGTAEHMMSDLEDPQAPGTMMQPIFFVNDQSLPIGSTDAERRQSLAKWLTATDNEWFAKAAVNRVWNEMMGRSFFDAVDDIGPDRTPRTPEVLDLLAQGFTENGYSLKWLVKTIALTDLYSRRSIEPTDQDVAWTAPYRVPLRSDQIFDRLVIALQISENAIPALRRGPGLASPRNSLALIFGFDPSDAKGEWAESIPQSLFLMNGTMLDRFVTSNNSLASRLVQETNDVDVQIEEVFAFSLSRRPTDHERSVMRQHLSQSSDRREGLEDLHWSLLNTSEFLHRD